MVNGLNSWINYIRSIMENSPRGSRITIDDIYTAIDPATCVGPEATRCIAKQILDALDKDGNGVLTPEDLQSRCVDMTREIECAANQLRPIIETLQPGNRIDCIQLVQWLQCQGKSPYLAQGMAQQLFEMFDKNKDGCISYEDMQTQSNNCDNEAQKAEDYIVSIMANMQPGATLNYQQIIQWLQGQGKPGHIANAIAQAIFSKLDSNHDCLLTREDLNRGTCQPVPGTGTGRPGTGGGVDPRGRHY